MPHHGLMDANQMDEEHAALTRSRLHLEGGRRRLQEGLYAAGVVTLYDALLFGMRYFIARPHGSQSIDLEHNEDLWDHAALYHALVKAGIFEDPHAFNHLSLIVEQALWQGTVYFDPHAILADVEEMLTRLGVAPFDETLLPHETLATR
ncbi:MAG: hypothetical protein AB1649_17805 [Chloroflexota bacterium]